MKIHSGFRFPAEGGQGITITGEVAEICYASHRECVCEAPVRFCSGVRVDAGVIGAFSFFNQHCSMRFIESIGRFGLFGPEVVAGGAVHPVESVSTHLVFQNMDCGWNRSFHHLYEDMDWLEKILRYQKTHEFAAPPESSLEMTCGLADAPQSCEASPSATGLWWEQERW